MKSKVKPVVAGASHGLCKQTLAHYLDENMQLKYAVLGARHIPDSHKAASLTQIITEVLDEYGILREKIHSFVRDGAMNAAV
ncbi:hypothetical protein Ddc_18449 [Ditylenchus destructor]|nr:hypothetical protein Ddc_18449 [Ditylenchus destructor]